MFCRVCPYVGLHVNIYFVMPFRSLNYKGTDMQRLFEIGTQFGSAPNESEIRPLLQYISPGTYYLVPAFFTLIHLASDRQELSPLERHQANKHVQWYYWRRIDPSTYVPLASPCSEQTLTLEFSKLLLQLVFR